MKKIKKSNTYTSTISGSYKAKSVDDGIRHLKCMVRLYTTGTVLFDKRKEAFNEILEYEKKVRKSLSTLPEKERIKQEEYIETFLHPEYKKHVKWILANGK